MLRNYIKFAWVFIWKFLYINDFTPFFGDFTPFFTHFSKIFFHFIIRLLKCYKNVYDLHRFSIRNSSKLAISHLFSRFHTFFSHLFQLFFYSLRTPHSYPPVKKRIVLIATSVLKFCLGTNFVTPYTIHTPYIQTFGSQYLELA